jgi:hypothetical protein
VTAVPHRFRPGVYAAWPTNLPWNLEVPPAPHRDLEVEVVQVAVGQAGVVEVGAVEVDVVERRRERRAVTARRVGPRAT